MASYVSKYYGNGNRATAEERAIRNSMDKVISDIQTFVNSYTLMNPLAEGVSADTLNSWYEEYPIIKEGIAVYRSKGKSVTEQRRFSTTVRTYVPTYTFDDLYKDEEEVGFVASIPQSPYLDARLSTPSTLTDRLVFVCPQTLSTLTRQYIPSRPSPPCLTLAQVT